jgi:hypothetical protein
MAKTHGRYGEDPCTSNRRRSSVMSISAVLNDSDIDSDERPRTNTDLTQQVASYPNHLPIRSRTHPSHQDVPPHAAPAANRPRAGSSSTQSSEETSSSPRRPNRPKYSEEEEAFIWFHRVDLRQEWDVVVDAFNRQFRHSYLRDKSGLECKLYRVLGAHGVPQIREWRKRGNRTVEEITYYGIVEWTNIRYPWMGPRYWAPR